MALPPDQLPEAEQEVALVEDQERLVDCPDWIEEADAVNVRVGIGVATTLLTVTVTDVEVRRFPTLSRATAVNTWVPLPKAVVFQERECGAVVSSPPKLIPSSLNCTLAIPLTTCDPLVGSEAEAEIVTVSETEVLLPGEVIETEGGVVSAGGSGVGVMDGL